MMRRASRSPLLLLAFVLAFAVPAAAAPVETLPTGGTTALNTEYNQWANVWIKLMNGDPPANPADAQHQQAVDAAAKWATYRLTWGLEKDPGKLNDLIREFKDTLSTLRLGKDKSQKANEMFAKQVIVHALEVLQTKKAVARINAARLLAVLPEKTSEESAADIQQGRLAGTNQADLADALASVIKDPTQNDGARLYAFRGLRLLLALPPQSPPTLPREKEDAALGAVIKFLQDHNKDFPPGAPQDEIDGYRYLRREAIMALAQTRYPTLADKTRPTLWLLKVALQDGVKPEPRLDERIEAAIGVAHASPDLDKDYQPDYAAHQLGFLVVDFINRYSQAQQGNPDEQTFAWKVSASRLIEALELMKAQSKNAHVARVVDESLKLLGKVEKALPPPEGGGFGLDQLLKAEASPNQQLYKGDAAAVVVPGGGKEAAPPEKPEDKKDK